MTRPTLCSALLLTAALASFQAFVSAQLPNPVTCPRSVFGESDFAWKARCDAEEEAERNRATERMRADMLARVKETERRRAELEKQAPLPAARNRLLGRWQSVAAGGDAFEQLIASVASCSTLFGEGILEFEAGRWGVSGRAGRRDMGQVSYRAGANGSVVALPSESDVFALLPFEFLSPDRVHLTDTTCTLVRTSAAVSSGRASGTVAPTGAKPAPAAVTTSQPSSTAAFEEALLKRWRGNFGYECPNGEHVALDRCTSEAPSATCVVVRVGQPPRNGALVTFTETYAALGKRIASCKLRPLRVVNGTLGFAP